MSPNVLPALLSLALLAGPAPDDAKPRRIAPVPGPALVTLGEGLARLDVPAGSLFLGREDAIHVLKRAGNPTDGSEIGLVHPANPTEKFFIVIEHSAVGHVPDDEKLDPPELLASIQKHQVQQNADRIGRKLPPIAIQGWAEPPAYDKVTRRVTWGVKARAGKEELINYRTRLLGRAGYLSFNLVTDPAAFAHDKAAVAEVIARTTYLAGQRYEDYQAGRDKDAGYGLADLVVGAGPGGAGSGGRAWGAWAATFAKVFLVVAGLLFAFFGRFIKRKARRREFARTELPPP